MIYRQKENNVAGGFGDIINLMPLKRFKRPCEQEACNIPMESGVPYSYDKSMGGWTPMWTRVLGWPGAEGAILAAPKTQWFQINVTEKKVI